MTDTTVTDCDMVASHCDTVAAPVAAPVHSSGGLVLTSADGRIVCRNTLDHRVHIAYEANLPDIRAKLFGTAAAGTH